MSNTLTTLDAIVKELYPADALGSTLLEGSALYREIPKNWKAYGNPIKLATRYASGAGSACTFADAQATIGSVTMAGWELTTGDEYSLFAVSGKAIATCKGEKGALVDVVELAGDNALERLKRNMHRALYRNFGGAIATVGSTAGTVLTLANVEDVVHFSVGDVIVSDNTDGTAGGADDAEYVTITAVDEDAGTLTRAGANWTAAGNFSDGDFLFHRGTFGLKLRGLDSWLPATAPGATPFFGVDRSVNPTKLGGIRFVADIALHQTIEGALVAAGGRAQRGGARPTHVFMHPLDYAQLVRELGDRVRYEKTMPRGSSASEVGFQTLMVATATGPVKVMIDVDCPYGVAYMLDIETWKLVGPQEPGWLMWDGKEMLRQSAADGVEGRMGCYWQMGCNAPGKNVRIDLSAVQVV